MAHVLLIESGIKSVLSGRFLRLSAGGCRGRAFQWLNRDSQISPGYQGQPLEACSSGIYLVGQHPEIIDTVSIDDVLYVSLRKVTLQFLQERRRVRSEKKRTGIHSLVHLVSSGSILLLLFFLVPFVSRAILSDLIKVVFKTSLHDMERFKNRGVRVGLSLPPAFSKELPEGKFHGDNSADDCHDQRNGKVPEHVHRSFLVEVKSSESSSDYASVPHPRPVSQPKCILSYRTNAPDIAEALVEGA